MTRRLAAHLAEEKMAEETPTLSELSSLREELARVRAQKTKMVGFVLGFLFAALCSFGGKPLEDALGSMVGWSVWGFIGWWIAAGVQWGRGKK